MEPASAMAIVAAGVFFLTALLIGVSMWSLVIAEIGGFAVLFYGVLLAI